MKYFIKTIIIIPAMLIVGCTTNNYQKFYSRIVPVLKTPSPTSNLSITGVVVPWHGPQSLQVSRLMQSHQGFAALGSYNFNIGRAMTPVELVELTSKAGGDYYVMYTAFLGMQHGARMVMTGYTTPRFISSTSQSSGYANGVGNYYGNNGYYGSANISANSYGNGSSQTVVGGSASYQAVPYDYPMYANMLTVLASPERQQYLIKNGFLTKEALENNSLQARMKRAKEAAFSEHQDNQTKSR